MATWACSVGPELALDLDFDTARYARGDDFRLRRWLVRPGLLYRFGDERVYGYVGGGRLGERAAQYRVEAGDRVPFLNTVRACTFRRRDASY